ncbi:hypothetical protein DTO271D3_3135 [Paecilomyces variotii]|nr:hypothetical protein DTO169C6_324 [Paecilomyces variotii]KAJ9261688.1 hypothetical protein DTO195F2_3946 [Paecilomyces variotii]KAJ9316628.1 hypothetical protein DTO271D3_3135 [Paecilomyces variotii]KAJ9329717.1 hypothetical protein DTO027B3_204 [Paecilomyces variotii]KAJ9337539.1 hypothetical protein DTO027B5_888 [Paecilomyces variotii]
MPRGADYDNGIPQSDNAIEQGTDAVHGLSQGNENITRANKPAPFPDGDFEDGLHSGQGSRGTPPSGSGKGGHDPKTLGERKGLGAHKADGLDPWK